MKVSANSWKVRLERWLAPVLFLSVILFGLQARLLVFTPATAGTAVARSSVAFLQHDRMEDQDPPATQPLPAIAEFLVRMSTRRSRRIELPTVARALSSNLFEPYLFLRPPPAF